MPHLLELFSGTRSIGYAFRKRGWQVTSVDIDAKSLPTICLDVMDLTVEDLLEYGNVDLIWSSPCTHYSCSRTTETPRDLESDALVSKVLDLADQLCCYYLLENPHSGLLKTRPAMHGINNVVLDYCRYGAHRKRTTIIWTNTDYIPLRPLCNKDCASSDGRRHARARRIGRGYSPTVYIPAELCDEIAVWADKLK